METVGLWVKNWEKGRLLIIPYGFFTTHFPQSTDQLNNINYIYWCSYLNLLNYIDFVSSASVYFFQLLPATFQAAWAEVDTVTAVINIWSITALVSTLMVTWSLIKNTLIWIRILIIIPITSYICCSIIWVGKCYGNCQCPSVPWKLRYFFSYLIVTSRAIGTACCKSKTFGLKITQRIWGKSS